MQFGDHGIELELRFWISDPQEGVNNVRSEVNRTIWALFKENNITIPVAQREIRICTTRAPTSIDGADRAARHFGAVAIPDEELEWKFIRSSGPGGQNVNKVASAVQLRFLLPRNTSIPAAAKHRLRRMAGQRLVDDGTILITARDERSQEQNRRAALERLADLIRAALDRAQDPQEDPPDSSFQRTAHRLEEEALDHQTGTRRRAGSRPTCPNVACRMSWRNCSDSTSCASAATPSNGSPNTSEPSCAVLITWRRPSSSMKFRNRLLSKNSGESSPYRIDMRCAIKWQRSSRASWVMFPEPACSSTAITR